MRAALVPLLLAACSLSGPPAETPAAERPDAGDEAGWVRFEPGAIRAVETDFRRQDPFEPDEAVRADIEARCPVVRRARYEPHEPPFGLLDLDVEGREHLARIAAHLPDDAHADAHFQEAEDGRTLRVPVACAACRLFLLQQLGDGRYAACVGPGYSLTLEDGAITTP